MNSFASIAEKLDTFARDCAVTVALKISDDSCKMDEDGRGLFMALYDALPSYQSELFDESIHTLIHDARIKPTAQLFAQIKKERERSMAIITQDRMKAFKSSVRNSLLIAKLTQNN
ncbi:MAG: hypothetical protein PHW18_10190 [Sulfuricurvum sp.]|uniref:hypothetical protein n=1 Tax=Sulfuricurvum sp. TaxID=2025608 RepID=UPI002631FA08|nr:hypothetical protein [Sulfuricurvum sp.]MDD2829931.1 hypothetical protein [Sulfuricurvum sp.]MDD4949579.1 hypothetical protein [Sulfuricurvum sp.]